MKIIKEKAVFQVTCTTCETTFTYQWEDVSTGKWSDEAESYNWVICPVCPRKIEHKFR